MPDHTTPPDTGALTRRDLIRVGAVGAGTIGAAGLLSACGSSGVSTTSQTQKPKRGGTLRLGLSGGGSTDSATPYHLVTVLCNCYTAQLYNSLVAYDRDLNRHYQLATEITPNSDATVWTVRLRPGVTFSNGKDLTAEDLIYTFQQIVNPKIVADAASYLRTLIPGSMKKLDKYTVEIPFSSPFSIFPDICTVLYGFGVVPVGFDPKHPVGTGPFKLQSLTPGVHAEFVRNENYWQPGVPYVDGLDITNVPDETGQVNGLIAGQFDLVDYLSPPSIAPVMNGGAHVLVSQGGGWNPFTMNCEQPPFSDVRVRQAFKLMVDRKQMLNVVYSGHGTIGNDLYGIFDPLYNHSLPQREQDSERAKFLLKQAGVPGLSVNLVTGPIAAGEVAAATVLAQQASAAGATVHLQTVTPSVLFGPNYTKWLFSQDNWSYYPYLLQVATSDLPGGALNETHYSNARYVSLYRQALATTAKTSQAELAHEMQAIYYDTSGYIIPFFFPLFDGYAKRVQGLVTSRTGNPFNLYDLKSLWLS